MVSTQQRNMAHIAILTLCLLIAALWATDTSRARSDVKRTLQAATSDEQSKLRATEAYGKLPLSFERNQGQTNGQVKFLSRGSGYNLFLTSTEAVLSLHQPGTDDKASSALRIKLVAASPHAKIEGLDKLPGKSNYFIGKNPRNWRTDISTFERVYYHEIYKGIDLVYYGNQRQLENDFVVSPGADASTIAIAFDGTKKIAIDKDGNLLLEIGGGQVQLQRPVIYQLADGIRQEVSGNYVLRTSGDVGFEVGVYDHARPLIIDPVLVYSSYLGGNGTEVGNAIYVDDAGSAYITGDTTSSIFPTVNPIDPTLGGTTDAFIVKINPSGSAIVYSTYLGGSSTDVGIDISVDGSQNAYITGRTASNDFPTMNAFDNAYSGGTVEDAFVVRVNAAGSALVYSTYLSGNFGARGCGIAANNSQGFAYVTGTTSTNFPVTASAFESTNFNSGFLTKLCTNCSGAASLVYSTFLAHTGFAEGRSIAADVGGNVYITGNLNATTTNFATSGAFQTTYGGGSADAFLEKLNTNLSGAASRIYATYLGGSAKDIGGADGSLNPGRAIAIDGSGNAYITGSTSSANFPLANAAQGVIGGQNDAFVSKLSANGTALIYSTYLGGTGDDFGKGVAVNIGGGASVTGVAGPNFPVVNNLLTPNPGIGFVAKLTPSGTAVTYSTILSGVTGGSNGIALDSAGNAFVTGSTNANIVTVFPFQPTNGGGGTDAWVSEIADPTIVGRVTDENGNPLSGATVNLTGVPTATTTTDANGGYTFGLLTLGNSYTVSVVVSNYIFTSATVNNLQKNVRRDFGPSVINISGHVTLNASGLSGVTITLGIGGATNVQTDASGNYAFNNLPAGRTYTVMASKTSFQFDPQSILFFQLLTDVQTANFVATALPTFSFSSPSFTAAEGGGALTIPVTRSNNTSGISTVSWAVPIESFSDAPCAEVHGKASISCDYTIITGILTFNPGETTKSFTVLINDDAYVEGNETFSMQLINPNGGAPVVGQPNVATITITDNDTVTPTTNPLDNPNAQFFAQEHYYDFLSREPDPGGLAFWANEITSCGSNQSCIDVKRVNVSAAFFLSIEFQETGYLVYRMYKAAYGNLPGAPVPVRYNEFMPDAQQIALGVQVGIGNWQAQLEANKVAFALAFVSRDRFTTAFPTTMTPTQFVDALYANGGVTPGAAERTSVINEFAGAGNTTDTAARGRALRRVAENSLLNQQETNRAFVLMQYFGYLRRNPNDAPEAGLDFAGYNFWLGKLNQFNGNFVNAEMVKAFINSGEYRQRFGP
jgi:hypothetical protein